MKEYRILNDGTISTESADVCQQYNAELRR